MNRAAGCGQLPDCRARADLGPAPSVSDGLVGKALLIWIGLLLTLAVRHFPVLL